MGEAEALPRGMENGCVGVTPGHRTAPQPFDMTATKQRRRTPGTARVPRLGSWNWKVPVVFEKPQMF